jgi:hypothetical protein
MISKLKNVILAGAATLTLVACGSRAEKDAALSPPSIAANSQLHHTPRLPEPGVWQLIVGPAADTSSND